MKPTCDDRESAARRVLAMPSERAAVEFGRLGLEEQREYALALPPGASRQDFLLRSPTARALVESLTPEDWVVTVKAIGEHDALPLIELSSDEQLGYLLDLELFVQDGLDLSRSQNWLELLAACGAQRMLRWLYAADFELLVLLFARTCIQIEREAVDEVPEALAGRVFSPDGFHFLAVKVGFEMAHIRQLVDLLFAEDRERFFALWSNMGSTMPAEVEELVLRWRNARLADRGWPEQEEALAFYQPLDPGSLATVEPPAGLEDAPRFPLQGTLTGGLLAAAVSAVEEEEARRSLATQLANLINRVVVAEGWLASELESLRQAAERVHGRLEIGLAELGAHTREQATRLLLSRPLLQIVQLAAGAIDRRRQRARVLRHRIGNGLLALLTDPIPERLMALDRSRPLFLAASGAPAREFASPTDLSTLDVALERAEAAAALAAGLGLSAGRLPHPFPPGSTPANLAGMSLETLLFTAFARDRLGLAPLDRPLPCSELGRLFAALPRERDALLDELEEWATGLAPQPPEGLPALLGEMADVALDELLAHDPAALDPRFVAGLWMQDDRGAAPQATA